MKIRPRAVVHQTDSTRITDQSYTKVHAEISAMGEGDLGPEEEQDVLDQFEESAERTLSLIKRLIDIRSVHSQVTDLEYELEDLEGKVAANPDRDYTASIQLLITNLAKDHQGHSGLVHHQQQSSAKTVC